MMEFYTMFLFCLLNNFGVTDTTLIAPKDLDLVGNNWKDFVYACEWQCEAGFKKSTGYCSTFSCFPCDCEETCAMLGTCCPTYDQATDSYSYPYGASPQTDPSRWYGLLDCTKPPYERSSSYLTVVRCPQSWLDGRAREQCERPTLDSMESITPLSDKKTGLVFPNAHCATCNGFKIAASQDANQGNNSEDVALSWPLKIECFHYQNLYRHTDMFEFVQSAHSFQGQCIVRFEPPKTESKRPRYCSHNLGKLSVPDLDCKSSKEVNDMCKSLPPLPSLVIQGYRNAFCALCDGIKLETAVCVTISSGIKVSSSLSKPLGILNSFSQKNGPPPPSYLPPMFLLFSPNSQDRQSRGTYIECPRGFWRNDMGNCSQASCSPGKLLDLENATCTTAIPQIVGLGYNVSLLLHPLTEASRKHVQEIHVGVVERTIKMLGGYHDLSVTFLISTCPGSDIPEHEEPIVQVKVTGYIIAPVNAIRDDFEELLETCILNAQWGFSVKDQINSTLSFQMVSVGQEMGRFYETIQTTLNRDQDGKINETSSCLLQSVLMEHEELPPFHTSLPIMAEREEFIGVTPSLTCPYVEVQITRTSWTENKTLLYSVTVQGMDLNITLGPGISMGNETLLVCLREYNALEKLTRISKTSSEETSTLLKVIFYLEITCTLISVTCLALSFITYCIFPSLRSLPGLNNMCLCFSLATAQTSLLITAVFGLKGQLSKTHCMVNGMFVHYSWLATFCWLNTCCVHMFRVFTGSRSRRPMSVRKAHLLYCLYSFGLPAVVVVATVALTSGLTKGDKIGYSDQLCFLDTGLSSLLVILPLLVPFGLAMVVNGALFILTVKMICSFARRQQSSNKSHEIVSYLRLSSVTGLFFLLEAVAVLTEEPILMLVATPFMALQGLFIFLSFTANKAVWTLYMGFVFRRVPVETKSSSASTTKITT